MFSKSIDREILNAFFPGWPISVYFQFNIPQPQESMGEIIEAASALSWSGYRIVQSQLEERLGLKLEQIAPPGSE